MILAVASAVLLFVEALKYQIKCRYYTSNPLSDEGCHWQRREASAKNLAPKERLAELPISSFPKPIPAFTKNQTTKEGSSKIASFQPALICPPDSVAYIGLVLKFQGSYVLKATTMPTFTMTVLMIEKEMVLATEITTVIVTNGNSRETALIAVVVLPKMSKVAFDQNCQFKNTAGRSHVTDG